MCVKFENDTVQSTKSFKSIHTMAPNDVLSANHTTSYNLQRCLAQLLRIKHLFKMLLKIMV